MKIYTKTGDAGASSLYSGERRPKDDAIFAALGDVDEARGCSGRWRCRTGAHLPRLVATPRLLQPLQVNSALGLAREHAKGLDAGLAAQVGGAGWLGMPCLPLSRCCCRCCHAPASGPNQPPLAICPAPPPALEQLEEIQSRLLDVGSAVATPRPTSSDAKLQRTAFSDAHTAALEGWIDGMAAQLPPLTQFILPSGAALVGHCCWGVLLLRAR